MVLLPERIRTYLFDTYPELQENMEFQWAFCRYFWEAHNTNNPFRLETMEKLQQDLSRILSS
jgi:hypothetical protein